MSCPKKNQVDKAALARAVHRDLSQGDHGYDVIRRLLADSCKLRKVPDENVDRDAASNALPELKELAAAHDPYLEEKHSAGTQRQQLAEQKGQIAAERSKKLRELQKTTRDGLRNPDRQAMGYVLEDLLQELFSLLDFDCRKPYKTAIEQIDGHEHFEGFDYLVEARWRKDQPTFEEINGFRGKVDSKLESTRGSFVAVQGVRPEVANVFSGRGYNLIIADGHDLAQMFERFVDLRDSLKFKIEKAAQEGRAFVSLAEFHH